ncbi:CheR family methyltransferase [Leptolyngbya sp. AN03gr2]|uniref:CheR family methyltransferase n=1 Tax=unclassified Leptolyngbya TaxID=2650499 RepID=UPI003D3193B0
MVQTTIEAMLRQKIGLDANSIGSNAIAYAIDQRRSRCGSPNLKDYYDRLQHSPEELNALIETVVVPETWFFRDREPFAYLKQWIQNEWKPITKLRVLSAPCSTGEEPYSIAITLVETGLSTEQFRIDAIDISQIVLEKAKKATYSKRSFRGNAPANLAYFEKTGEQYQLRSHIRNTVQFVRENLVEPRFVLDRQYDVIFCRNLLIYLDQESRSQVMNTLDRALVTPGLLFVGAAETSQVPSNSYELVHHSGAFAHRKVERPKPAPTVPILQSLPPPKPSPKLPKMEQAKQCLKQGKLIEAVRLCEAHLICDRTDTNAYFLLSKIYQELKQLPQAEQALQKAIYLNPKFYDALIELAVLKEQQGDFTTANILRARVQRLLNL